MREREREKLSACDESLDLSNLRSILVHLSSVSGLPRYVSGNYLFNKDYT